MARQLFLVFFGYNRLSEGNEVAYKAVREVPMLMRVPLLVLAALSLGIWYSFEPFDFHDAWPMQVLQLPQLAVPGSLTEFGAANRLYEIREAASRFHNFTGITSGILVAVGLFLGYLIYHLFNSRGTFYTQRFSFKGSLAKLSYSNWHLDAIYRRTVVAFGAGLMHFASWLDRRVIDRLVDLVGVLGVVLGHVVYWIDRTFVDGTVSLSVWVSGIKYQALNCCSYHF